MGLHRGLKLGASRELILRTSEALTVAWKLPYASIQQVEKVDVRRAAKRGNDYARTTSTENRISTAVARRHILPHRANHLAYEGRATRRPPQLTVNRSRKRMESFAPLGPGLSGSLFLRGASGPLGCAWFDLQPSALIANFFEHCLEALHEFIVPSLFRQRLKAAESHRSAWL